MSAYGVYSTIKAIRLIEIAEIISALSIDAFNCRTEPFSEVVQLIRLHKGQLITARKINKYLRGSDNIKQPKGDVQDPYSFRCIPQVHGAVRDTFLMYRR
jgi:histidine ammonia-lyase